MFKIIFFAVFFFYQLGNVFSQQKTKIFLSLIKGGHITESQLLDTSIKIITTSPKEIKGVTNIYFSGSGFLNVLVIQKFIGSKLMIGSWSGLKEKLIVGSKITIGGYLHFDKKTKKKIYFEESTYTVVPD